MATRTLAQFRAERQLWRKDVAQTLGISEEALEALERSPQVPPEIAQKITAAYNLPPDYFAVDLDAVAAAAVQAQKKAPQNPLAYFYKVSWVWQILTLLILSVVISVPVIVQTILGDAPDILTDIFTVIYQALLLTSGALLCRYILQKTTFAGEIAKVKWLLLPLAYFGTQVISGIALFFMPTEQELRASLDSSMFAFFGSMASDFVFGVLELFLVPLFMAGILWVASMEDGEARRKKQKMLFWAMFASLTLYRVLYVVCYLVIVRKTMTAPASTWVWQVFWYLLAVAVLFAATFGPKKLPKCNAVWLVALPVVDFMLSSVIGLLRSIF